MTPRWQFIPTDVLNQGQRQQEAQTWAEQQRKQLAQQWGDMARQSVADMLDQEYGEMLRQSQQPPAPLQPVGQVDPYGSPVESQPLPPPPQNARQAMRQTLAQMPEQFQEPEAVPQPSLLNPMVGIHERLSTPTPDEAKPGADLRAPLMVAANRLVPGLAPHESDEELLTRMDPAEVEQARGFRHTFTGQEPTQEEVAQTARQGEFAKFAIMDVAGGAAGRGAKAVGDLATGRGVAGETAEHMRPLGYLPEEEMTPELRQAVQEQIGNYREQHGSVPIADIRQQAQSIIDDPHAADEAIQTLGAIQPGEQSARAFAVRQVAVDASRRAKELEQELASPLVHEERAFELRLQLDKVKDLEVQAGIAAMLPASEAGRLLRVWQELASTRGAAASLEQYERVNGFVKDAQKLLAGDIRNGKLSNGTRKKLETLRSTLNGEVKRNGAGAGARQQTPTPRTQEPTTAPAEQSPHLTYILNNQKMAELRQAGSTADDPELAALVQEQQTLFRQLQGQARQDVQEQLAKGGLKPPTREELDKRMAAQLRSKLRQAEEEAQSSPRLQERQARQQEMAAQRTAQAEARRLNRGVEQQMVKEQREGIRLERDIEAGINRQLAQETLDSIDRLISAGMDRTQASTLLRQLQNVSFESEQLVRSYKEKINRQAVAPIVRKQFRDLTPEQRKEKIKELANEMKRVDWTKPREAAKFAEGLAQNPSLWERLHMWRLAAMLSGTGTLVVNALGNTVETLSAPAVRLGAAVGEDIRTLGGPLEQKNATYRQVIDEIGGFFEGLAPAFREAKETWVTGYSSRPIREMATQKAQFLGPVGYPFRALATTDDFFRTLNQTMALRAEARLVAQKSGRSVEEVMQSLAKNPEVLERAHQEALKRTFQQRLGGTGRLINAIRNQEPLAKVILPFFTTLANIASVGLERTPLGFAKAAGTADPAQAAMIRGNAILGTSVMALGAALSEAGVLVGYGPRDEAEARDFTDQGGGRYSALINGEYTNLTNVLGAWAIPLFTGAALAEAMKYSADTSKDQEAIERIGRFMGEFITTEANFFMDTTGMKGVADFVEALDPRRPDQADRFVQEVATSALPAAGLVATFARALDPGIKNVKTLEDAIKARLPLLSQQVPNRQTQLGEDRVRGGQGLEAGLPFRSTLQNQDPILQEYQRLRGRGIEGGLGMAGESVEGLDLSREEQRVYQQVLGQKFREVIGQVMNDPRYQQADDARKAEILERAESVARNDARQQFLREHVGREEFTRRRRELATQGSR